MSGKNCRVYLVCQYEEPTSAQNESLTWLVRELVSALNINGEDIYRHPDVRFKEPGEAEKLSVDLNQEKK
jgi:hypothetical protein